jgi:hypothetical protein
MPQAHDREGSTRNRTEASNRKPNSARKGIVEPVIGQIKHARSFRQFLLRGFEQVQGEWSLVCTTHNILMLYRLCV